MDLVDCMSRVALMNEILPDYIITTYLENNFKNVEDRKQYLIFLRNLFKKAIGRW